MGLALLEDKERRKEERDMLYEWNRNRNVFRARIRVHACIEAFVCLFVLSL
jgi:hypothetical protein